MTFMKGLIGGKRRSFMYLLNWMMGGAFAVSLLLMPLLMLVARRLGIVDQPAHRKTHAKPIPYLGGIGIAAGFTAAAAVLCLWSPLFPRPAGLWRTAAIVGPALGALLLGLVDDKYSIRARYKLLGQIVIALGVSVFLYRIEVIKLPGMGSYEFFSWESIPLTVLWMLCVINGTNLIDGVDGLAGSVTALTFAVIAILALYLPQADLLVAGIALAACGAALGFLCFNWRPARIYMGDAGSLACGALIATLLLALGQQQRFAGDPPPGNNPTLEEPYSYQFAKITLVAFYPMLELALSVVRRLLRGKPIGSADNGHIHHRLLRSGVSAPLICLFAMLLTTIAGSTVVAAELGYRGVSSWLLLACGGSVALLLHFCGVLELVRPRMLQGNRPHYLIANHFSAMQRHKLELAHTLEDVSTLIEQTCVEFGVERYELRLAGAGPHVVWTKPASAHGSILPSADAPAQSGPTERFSDKVERSNGAHAAWTFEPHVFQDELDIEYHVLMSDFMSQALVCAERLAVAAGGAKSLTKDESARSVSSSALRKRGHPSRVFQPHPNIKE
jgi:UDP-GlcNAc:undecaprenyl-phosphate GlcNAc-1-phosphate transferase